MSEDKEQQDVLGLLANRIAPLASGTGFGCKPVVASVADMLRSCVENGWSCDDSLRLLQSVSAMFQLEYAGCTMVESSGGNCDGNDMRSGGEATQLRSGEVDSKSTSGLNNEEEKKRGKWYRSNKKKEEKRKQRGSEGKQQVVIDYDVLAKQTLAKRRAAENLLQEKIATMKLNSLQDEAKCRQYEALKRQRIAQWTNESREKSISSELKARATEQSGLSDLKRDSSLPSVDRCATLPSSSAGLSSFKDDMISVSSSEMRQVLKANSDLEFELSQAMRYIDQNQHNNDEPYLTPACAATEEIHEDMLMMGYEISESRPEDLATVLRSYAQEPDIRTIPHADRFQFRLNQLERRVNMNTMCGI